MSKLESKTAADLEAETMVARMRLTIAEQRETIARLKSETALASAMLPDGWNLIPIEAAFGMFDGNTKQIADLAISRGKSLEAANGTIAKLRDELSTARANLGKQTEYGVAETLKRDQRIADLERTVEIFQRNLRWMGGILSEQLLALGTEKTKVSDLAARLQACDAGLIDWSQLSDADLAKIIDPINLTPGKITSLPTWDQAIELAKLKTELKNACKNYDMAVAANDTLTGDIVAMKQKLYDAGILLSDAYQTGGICLAEPDPAREAGAARADANYKAGRQPSNLDISTSPALAQRLRERAAEAAAIEADLDAIADAVVAGKMTMADGDKVMEAKHGDDESNDADSPEYGDMPVLSVGIGSEFSVENNPELVFHITSFSLAEEAADDIPGRPCFVTLQLQAESEAVA